jgi:hypothetical protein
MQYVPLKRWYIQQVHMVLQPKRLTLKLFYMLTTANMATMRKFDMLHLTILT